MHAFWYYMKRTQHWVSSVWYYLLSLESHNSILSNWSQLLGEKRVSTITVGVTYDYRRLCLSWRTLFFSLPFSNFPFEEVAKMFLRDIVKHIFVIIGSFVISKRVHFVDQYILLVKFYMFFLSNSVMMFDCGKRKAPSFMYVLFFLMQIITISVCILMNKLCDCFLLSVHYRYSLTSTCWISRSVGREIFISCKCGR